MSRYLFYISQNYSFAILRPLQEAILRRGGQVAWFVEGKEVNLDFFRENELLLTNIKTVKEFSPIAVFVPGNVVPSFIPGVKIALFHGFNAGKRKDDASHFSIRGCFDLYCTQGPSTTERFELLAEKHGFFQVSETGWPAIDPLHKNITQKVEGELPTVLYCSTFSRNLTSAPHLFDEIKRLSATGKYKWVVQFHPKMQQDLVAKYKSLESEYLSFIETDNIIPLLQQSDLMVCDTSSVLIMFLLLNKPVVTFNNAIPGEHLLNISDPKLLEESIDLGLSKPDLLMSHISKYINEIHPYKDGRSSERVLDAVDDFLSKPNSLPNKPLNLLRQLKMRKKLGYWKFW